MQHTPSSVHSMPVEENSTSFGFYRDLFLNADSTPCWRLDLRSGSTRFDFGLLALFAFRGIISFALARRTSTDKRVVMRVETRSSPLNITQIDQYRPAAQSTGPSVELGRIVVPSKVGSGGVVVDPYIGGEQRFTRGRRWRWRCVEMREIRLEESQDG